MCLYLRMRFNYWWPSSNSRIADHGVLAFLDAKKQVIELVWKNSSTFLKHPYLLFLILKYLYPVVNLTCFSRRMYTTRAECTWKMRVYTVIQVFTVYMLLKCAGMAVRADPAYRYISPKCLEHLAQVNARTSIENSTLGVLLH